MWDLIRSLFFILGIDFLTFINYNLLSDIQKVR